MLHLNTLDYERWGEKIKEEDWLAVYGNGWRKTQTARPKDHNRDFQFDVLMANPPFAGDIKETRILAKYDLARSVSFDKIANVDPDDKNIVDARQQAPGFAEALHASHEVIYQIADGTYRKVKVKNQSQRGPRYFVYRAQPELLKAGRAHGRRVAARPV